MEIESKEGISLCGDTPFVLFMITNRSLENTLCHHCLGYLHEARYVSAFHLVDVAIRLLTILHALLVDVLHDALQLLIDLLSAPAQLLRILCHLQT